MELEGLRLGIESLRLGEQPFRDTPFFLKDAALTPSSSGYFDAPFLRRLDLKVLMPLPGYTIVGL